MPLLPTGFLAFIAAFNLYYDANYAPRHLSPELTAVAAAAVQDAPARHLVFADATVMDALGYPLDRPMRDAMMVNAWPAYQQDFTAIPAGRTFVLSLAGFVALSGQGEGRLVRPPLLAQALIAPAGPRVDREAVCVLDQASSALIAADFNAAVARYCRQA